MEPLSHLALKLGANARGEDGYRKSRRYAYGVQCYGSYPTLSAHSVASGAQPDLLAFGNRVTKAVIPQFGFDVAASLIVISSRTNKAPSVLTTSDCVLFGDPSPAERFAVSSVRRLTSGPMILRAPTAT
jgi:hypothetical protein